MSLVRPTVFFKMVWNQNSFWSSTSGNGQRLTGLSPHIPAKSSHKAYGKLTSTQFSSLGALRVTSEGNANSNSPPGPDGHSCILMLLFHPPIPPEKETGKMEWLCSLLRTSILKNKQAEVSLIWPIFNSGRRQLVLGQREWKRKRGSGTHTLRAAMLDGECATSEDGKVKGRLSIRGLWHFQRHRSTDARLPVAFLRFSWGRSDRLSPCLSRS